MTDGSTNHTVVPRWHSDAVGTTDVDAVMSAGQLSGRGFVVLSGSYDTAELAWESARPVIEMAATEDAFYRTLPSLHVVAEYTLPPPGVAQRSFQVLHIDFGVPLGLAAEADIVRYTVLHRDASTAGPGAATRIVTFDYLATQRAWPEPHDLAERLRSREGDPDLSEGVLARIVEAADGSAELPAKTSAGFMCGLEFDTIEDERSFLAGHRLDLDRVEHQIVLHPGQVLIFDNLRSAHGRLGTRQAEELHQLCFGYPSLSPADQTAVLLHTLGRLTGPEAAQPTMSEDVALPKARQAASDAFHLRPAMLWLDQA